jgi:hypothetical protein
MIFDLVTWLGIFLVLSGLGLAAFQYYRGERIHPGQVSIDPSGSVTVRARRFYPILMGVGATLIVAGLANRPRTPPLDPTMDVPHQPRPGKHLPAFAVRPLWQIHLQDCRYESRLVTNLRNILARELNFTAITPSHFDVRDPLLPRHNSVVYYGDSAEAAEGLAWELSRRAKTPFTFERATSATGGFRKPETTLIVGLIGQECQV